MYKLIIKPTAELDATEAANWYNGKWNGLGDEFLLALEASMYSIRRNPKQFQVIHKQIRRALTDRFPYGIFFTVEDKTIYVIAILHTKRNPKTWKDRE